MTCRELAELVRTMRRAQKDYYLYKRRPDLQQAKQLEQEVDRVIERELGPSAGPMLWDRVEGQT